MTEEQFDNQLPPLPEPELPMTPRSSFASRFVARVLRRQKDPQLPHEELEAEAMPMEETETTTSYAEDMAAWEKYLEKDITETQIDKEKTDQQLDKAEKLFARFGKSFMEGREWLLGYDRMDTAIRRRYGGIGDLVAKSNSLKDRLYRRDDQLYQAQQHNWVVEYADEVDPKLYKRFIPEAGLLGERYSLPTTDHPTASPAEAAELLNSLPFIDDELVHKKERPDHPTIMLRGPIMFPTERIISMDGFSSFAGRGESGRYGELIANGKGGKGFTPRHFPGMEQTSRGAIVDMAQKSAESFKNVPGGPTIKIVQDSTGEYWGVASESGHRLSAAKLRGEAYMPVHAVEIHADEDMPHLNFDVRSFFEEQLK